MAAICFSASAIFAESLVVGRLAFGLGLGRRVIARGLGERLGVGARLGQHLLMRGGGGVGPLLHRGRVVEVAGDPRLAILDHLADLGQCALRQEPVKEAERDGEPEQLRRKCVDIERREVRLASALVADFRLRCFGLGHRRTFRCGRAGRRGYRAFPRVEGDA